MKKKTILFFLMVCGQLLAQTSEGTLFQKLMKADSLLFHEGFNRCNFTALEDLISEDLEFYHDQGGVTTTKKDFLNNIKKNICSGLRKKPIRKLKSNTYRVFPLYSGGKLYGAIQKGEHDFFIKEPGKELVATSTASFTHLWLLREDNWILKRVLSYDHKDPTASVEPDASPPATRATMETRLKRQNVPALGVAHLSENRLTEIRVYGDLQDNIPAPYNTIFNVASLTKPIVSLLTLKLTDNNDWDLDEPLHHYWTDPDVENDPNSKLLSTRHILSHQSGFRNWRWQNDSGKLEFMFEPGTGFHYSGEGFEYLKKALENKFKRPLEVLADSLLFTPLQMQETKFRWDDSVDEQRFAKWHDSQGRNAYMVSKDRDASAADDLLTTLEDYGRFAEFVLNGAGLSKEIFREMIKTQNGTEQPVKMGLGWEILPDLEEGQYALLHTGGDKGVQALVMLLPETGEGIVIFTNGDNGNRLYGELIEKHLSLGKQIMGRDKN